MSDDLLAQMLGDVGRAQGSGQALAGEPDLGGRIADLLAVAGHHSVDRGADLFGDALRRAYIRRRRLVEGGERPLGGHWGVMFS
jgi:hypothetical protein